MRSAQGDEGESGGAGWSKALIRARHAIRSALAEKWNASAEEQERVADILKRAAQEIAAKEPRK
jgi:hypothetical protein